MNRVCQRRQRTCSRGVTLLELIFCTLALTLIALFTAAALGDGRALRERAKHRAELALIAQGELDRLRGVPLAQLTEGQQTIHRDNWPPSVQIIDAISKRGDGYLDLKVSAERKSTAGDLKVVLVSLHPGGRR